MNTRQIYQSSYSELRALMRYTYESDTANVYLTYRRLVVLQSQHPEAHQHAMASFDERYEQYVQHPAWLRLKWQKSDLDSIPF